MIRFKNLATTLVVAMTTLFTSCSDEEYKQIYLYDTETKTRITDGKDLNIFCYREHKFIVRGGSGGYSIDYLEGGNVSAEWGSKDTLKLTGNFPIKASIRISDDMDNSAGMGINVEYLNLRYRVDSLYSEIKGDHLEIIELKDIQRKIEAYSETGIGSTLIFIYDDETDPNQGQLRITNEQSQIMGNIMKFKAEKEVSLGTSPTITYQKFYIYDEENSTHEYTMIKEYTSDQKISKIKMMEEVKDRFKEEPYYAKIESARMFYDLTEIGQK